MNALDLKHIDKVYFLGIGGIGMSGLARYFKFRGMEVAGYDRTATSITRALQEEGVDVHYEDHPDSIPEAFRVNTPRLLVVYTPAIPQTNVEWNYFVDGGFAMLKRAEVLGLITRDSKCLAVAGTHGKTTTSSILAHLLKASGYPITAFLGGVSENFNSNFLIEGEEITVVEADEFDRSFLQLDPDIACVTSMDADHLDIYGEKAVLEEGFRAFVKKIKPGGKLLVRYGLPLNGITYGFEPEADYRFENIKISNSAYTCDLVTPYGEAREVVFRKPGQHNLLNALVALGMAVELGAPLDRLTKALESFKGVKRRFSYQIFTPELVYIDDYAHHPTEIEAVHEAVRSFHPDRRITAVFQPHLYSRTRDFLEAFAGALEKFDEIILMEIYPARELPIPGINADLLLSKIEHPRKQVMTREALLGYLGKSQHEVVVSMGAGDIGAMVNDIKNVLIS
ncbi:UDP-N-acetylmuramate--L-alanine ligase [Robertkochia sediminum]|uniref:UDP-N-acetylmuramate--L-alanine ligase n=1 Tax=Robertkochia sediminum TaxID=2785326 RepID=UPI001931A659|nr:UDP-N-acetylmuramate--L-alanine ligase [Robertkochia sediminum]MBL7472476.1 UDP-N-acetylmuramate--L-alanine ligase [Robertkochia sediminum]